MSQYNLIDGDLLYSDAQYICHQCNCVSNTSSGLAAAIFKKFPWADIYTDRVERDIPGTISVQGNGDDQRFVLSIFGQYYPGVNDYSNDNLEMRQRYFYQALGLVLDMDIQSIAFPWKIGCGLAGGDWDGWYEPVLDKFAGKMKDRGAETYVYRIENTRQPRVYGENHFKNR